MEPHERGSETEINGPGRMEAFSDGVMAIIITIMVLELKVPHDPTPGGLLELWPTFTSYALSFMLVAVYWMNHQRLLKHVRHASHAVLWWNLLLLFFLSLIPFATAFVGENHLETFPTAIYGLAMLLPALTYWGLHRAILAANPAGAASRTLGHRATRKNAIAIAVYVIGIALAPVQPALTMLAILAVAIMYFLPDAFT